jgi:hypothetical protein
MNSLPSKLTNRLVAPDDDDDDDDSSARDDSLCGVCAEEEDEEEDEEAAAATGWSWTNPSRHRSACSRLVISSCADGAGPDLKKVPDQMTENNNRQTINTDQSEEM